jgi:long-chain acyl-CoA synthetase
MMGGLKLVMIEGRFDPVKALSLIEAERVTLWTAVPTMVWRVCEAPERHDYDTSTVVSVSFGGSPSADEMQRRIRETFPNVKATTNAYGLTESSSVATTLSGADALRKADSVGLPMPTVEVAIAGPDGRTSVPNQTGEVLLRGPIIMPGYWNKPEATASTVIDGWLHTGDVGHLDDEGYLFITDRAKDMLIRGGENVYCVEIENRLVEHPAIADAAVIGVPHDSLGEEVKAVIEVAGRRGHRRRDPPVGRRDAGDLQGAHPHRPVGRQAAAQRLGQAAEERAARRGPRQLRRDDVRPWNR